jgi:hypothetical protein
MKLWFIHFVEKNIFIEKQYHKQHIRLSTSDHWLRHRHFYGVTQKYLKCHSQISYNLTI